MGTGSLSHEFHGNILHYSHGCGVATMLRLMRTAGVKARLTGTDLSAGSGVGLIAAGANHSLAVKSGGAIYAWGNNANSQLGNGNTTSSNSPGPVSGGGLSFTGAVLAAGSSHTCAVRSNSATVCWGSDGSGQLGDGGSSNQLKPVAVKGLNNTAALTNATAIAAGLSHACALIAFGTANCWGANGSAR